jgi:hypothetical protein
MRSARAALLVEAGGSIGAKPSAPSRSFFATHLRPTDATATIGSGQAERVGRSLECMPKVPDHVFAKRGALGPLGQWGRRLNSEVPTEQRRVVALLRQPHIR